MRGGVRELALFAGAGGGILGGLILGWRTVCAVEVDPYCRSVLLARQRDGLLSAFPIWDDVRTFDGRPWRGCVDVVSGGFPCQDISSAGTRKGLHGERSGLWREFARIVREAQPPFVFIENSPHLRTRGLVTVLSDLAEMGFDAEWGVLGAEDVGAPHARQRMWIVANANGGRERSGSLDDEVAGASPPGGLLFTHAVSEILGCAKGGARGSPPSMARQREFAFQAADSNGETIRIEPGRCGGAHWKEASIAQDLDWWPVDLIQGVDDGMAHRMDRVAATGNGQVPGVAALAWETLK